jgi:hypothetical protein
MPSRGSSRHGRRAETLLDFGVKRPTGPLNRKYAQDLADWLGEWVTNECQKGLFTLKSYIKLEAWRDDLRWYEAWLEAEGAEASARRLKEQSDSLIELVIPLSSACLKIKGQQPLLLSSEDPEFDLRLQELGVPLDIAFRKPSAAAGLLHDTLTAIAVSSNHPSRAEVAPTPIDPNMASGEIAPNTHGPKPKRNPGRKPMTPEYKKQCEQYAAKYYAFLETYMVKHGTKSGARKEFANLKRKKRKDSNVMIRSGTPTKPRRRGQNRRG